MEEYIDSPFTLVPATAIDPSSNIAVVEFWSRFTMALQYTSARSRGSAAECAIGEKQREPSLHRQATKWSGISSTTENKGLNFAIRVWSTAPTDAYFQLTLCYSIVLVIKG